jgi:transcription elongation GreA/GreB family factor
MRATLLFLLLFAGVASAASPRASLRAEALVVGDRLRLGDVVELVEVDAALAGKLAAIDLGAAPRAGQSARVGAKRIAAFVNRREKAARALSWEGAGSVLVRREGQAVPVEDIRAALAANLRGARVDSLALTEPTRPMLLPQSRYELRAERVELSGDCASGRAQLSAFDANKHLATMPVHFDVIAAREEICAGGVNVDKGPQPAAASGATRHETVAVELRENGVVLQTSAIALREVRVGDMVAVRNPVSDETYRVRVVAPGRASFALE